MILLCKYSCQWFYYVNTRKINTKLFNDWFVILYNYIFIYLFIDTQLHKCNYVIATSRDVSFVAHTPPQQQLLLLLLLSTTTTTTAKTLHSDSDTLSKTASLPRLTSSSLSTTPLWVLPMNLFENINKLAHCIYNHTRKNDKLAFKKTHISPFSMWDHEVPIYHTFQPNLPTRPSK
jgi:hypothetical protein